MRNYFEQIVDIVLTIAIIFLVPLIYFGQKSDIIIQTLASESTISFGNEIRSKGYLSKDMYDNFLMDLSNTGLLYEVDLEQRHTVYEPEYRMRTADEIIEEQDKAYTGSNIYTYRPVRTEIPYVNDPVNNGTLNSETNESVLASAVNTPASASHVHTDDCYGGHRHDGAMSYTTLHKHDTNCLKYAAAYLTYATCYNCSKRYLENQVFYYWDDNNNRAVFSSGHTYTKCWYCDSTRGGYGQATTTAYGWSCGFNKDIDGDGYTDDVGKEVAYSYTLSAPPPQYYRYPSLNDGSNQIVNKGMTYKNGCYTYHLHGYIPMYSNSWHPSPYGPLNDIAGVGGAENNCRLPDRFTFYLWHDDYGDMYTQITYKTEIQADESVLFKFESCYGFDNNLWCPRTLTWSQLYNYFLYSSRFLDFCRTYYKSDYLYGISSSDLILKTSYNTNNVNKCSLTSGWYPNCGQTQSTNLSCDKLMISITPTHPVQTVAIGDPLITTVTATYADGSTKVLVATSTFSTNAIIQNTQAPLTYTYSVDGISYFKSCNITVTVIPRSKTCVNEHMYNLKTDGSDPGCPYCKSWLRSLAMTYPTTGSMTIYKGTTLSENGVTLLATYLDGHTEYLYNEYVDNLDKQYVGTQNVTLSYKGKYVYLTVITKRNLTKCTTCSRFYELYPDGSDPGCPYCLSRTPIFTGNVMEYETKYFDKDILKELYEGSGTYYFTNRDSIVIDVKNTKASMSQNLMKLIFKGLGETNIQVVDAGYIRENGSMTK